VSLRGRRSLAAHAARLLAGALVALVLAPTAGAGDARLFVAPPPGSYELPPIDRVHDHTLLDPAGTAAPLLGLAPGQVALVAFVYRACADACPMALATLRSLDRRLAADAAVGARVRLVTVSFDPVHDTPGRMGELARDLGARDGWRFLTARDEEALEPVLADFHQDVLRGVADGPPAIQHVLKVSLVDAHRDVRNVYSTGFFDEELVWNDLATVLAGG